MGEKENERKEGWGGNRIMQRWRKGEKKRGRGREEEDRVGKEKITQEE